MHALDDVHILAMKIAGYVEPAGVVEPDRVDDHRISLPMADRLALPGAVLILARRWGPAIGHDRPVSIAPALGSGTHVKKNHQLSRLNDFCRCPHARDASRLAAERRVFSITVR